MPIHWCTSVHGSTSVHLSSFVDLSSFVHLSILGSQGDADLRQRHPGRLMSSIYLQQQKRGK